MSRGPQYFNYALELEGYPGHSRAVYIGTSYDPQHRIEKEHFVEGHRRSNKSVFRYGTGRTFWSYRDPSYGHELRDDAESAEKSLAKEFRAAGYHVIRS